MTLQKNAAVVVGLILMVSIAGCPGPKTSSVPDAVPKASSEDLLQSAVHQLRPENYTIAAESDKPIELLNSWIGMATEHGSDGSSLVDRIPAVWTPGKVADRLKKQVYDFLDATHIRDCMLLHRMSDYLGPRGKTELERVTAVFDFVVRNISLRGPGEGDLPLNPYHLLLLGKGSAEDRAWVCSALLRQLRIDTVIVRSARL